MSASFRTKSTVRATSKGFGRRSRTPFVETTTSGRALLHPVRHEPAAVVGDRPGRLPDPDSAGSLADDPASDDGVLAVEFGQRRERLIDELPLAIIAAALRESAPLVVEGHVGAFAREERFPDVARELALVEGSLEEVGISRVEPPQDRQDPLAREDALPRRLDPLRRSVGEEVVPEILFEQP